MGSGGGVERGRWSLSLSTSEGKVVIYYRSRKLVTLREDKFKCPTEK